ncbi:MAG: 4Fe-4S binding protein [Desulfobacterales bacterium]|nr:4Fe-4S binding protein [Desulfobacterales bacterium]
MSHIHRNQYVLKNVGSATPVFSVEDKTPLADHQLQENLLLQSGFPSEAASPGSVVSTALQLNGDCTTMDEESLVRFVETYGGILEIEPLLLGSYSPRYTTADELEISSADRGYSLSYTARSVVNRSLCNYCGVCGRICPVQCISEELHFDFDTCTLCNECEKKCPEKVIAILAKRQQNPPEHLHYCEDCRVMKLLEDQ